MFYPHTLNAGHDQ